MILHAANQAASGTVPIWIAIVAAAIGAGGAVIAQVVSAIFTALRERRRMVFDRETRLSDDANSRKALLFESKKTSYAKALVLFSERIRWSAWEIKFEGTEVGNQTLASWPRQNEWYAEWAEVRAEITLLDTSVKKAVDELVEAFETEARPDSNLSQEQVFEHTRVIGFAEIAVRKAMTKSLGIDE